MSKRRKKKGNSKWLFLILIIFAFIYGLFFDEINKSFGLMYDSNNNPIINNNGNDKNNSVSSKLKIYFLDVGQADSILIRNGNNNMLIDAGNNNDGKLLVSYFKGLNIDSFKYVVGTHPHVIQPVEFIDNTLVIYSLGNLVSAQYQDQNYNKMVGLMTSFDIVKTVKGKNKSIKIDNVNNELTYTYYKSYRKFKVVPFSSSEIGNYLSGYEKVYNTYKEVVTRLDDNMMVVPLSGSDE